MQRDKLRYVLGAATITAVALMLILAFGRVATRATESAAPDDVAALQAENAKLAQAVKQMQQREAQYRAEINTANQTISQLMALTGMTASSGQGALDGQFFDDSQSAPQQLFGNRGFFFDDDDGSFERGSFGDGSQQFFGRELRGF